MTDDPTTPPDPPVTRRGFLGAVGGLTVGAAAGGLPAGLVARPSAAAVVPTDPAVEPFYGEHQGGILTAPQRHTSVVALDVTTERRDELAGLLRHWTGLAADLTAGRIADPGRTSPDSGEAVDLGPARLTVAVGLGPGLFGVDGDDRFGLADRWPIQLAPLPAFPVDAMAATDSGGDLVLQASADDPQVVFHAVRQLVRAGAGITSIRWTQDGFDESAASPGTPRNLLGFKDGTANPTSVADLDRFVWAGPEAPAWMAGGTYLVVRRIRVALDRWDAEPVASQERIIGRHKASGAPLGRTAEDDPLDLDARQPDGQPVIPADAHVRLASPQANWGVTLLRRSCAYANGVTAPSGGGGPALDAGVLFTSFQRDPRLAFVPIVRSLASDDALSRFTSHTASAVAAVPPAPAHPGRWLGQALFE